MRFGVYCDVFGFALKGRPEFIPGAEIDVMIEVCLSMCLFKFVSWIWHLVKCCDLCRALKIQIRELLAGIQLNV